MATPEKPPRPWDIDDLLDLGKQSEGIHLKAVPVLILENWVRGERQEGVANYVRTKDLARRLESSKLVAGFKPKATSNILAALTKIQNGRNLTRPPLIESQGRGICWINLPRYEPLFQEHRQIYRERYPEDYRKLFPEGEPEWERPSLPKKRAKRKEGEPIPSESEMQDEIHSLLAPLEQALREREQTIERLAEENAQLQVDWVAMQAALQEKQKAPPGTLPPEHRIADEELRNDCAELLENKKFYINAIRSAGVVLEERLRNTMGGVGASEYGTALVDLALKKESGGLVISEHSAEQEGVHMLFRGAVQFVRNPPMHKKLRYTESEAWGAVGLIDYLLLLLQQAKPREK